MDADLHSEHFEHMLMRHLAGATLVAATPSFDEAMLDERWGVSHHGTTGC